MNSAGSRRLSGLSREEKTVLLAKAITRLDEALLDSIGTTSPPRSRFRGRKALGKTESQAQEKEEAAS